MDLNDLLKEKGIDPAQVIALRHRPSTPAFSKVLPWLAADHPHLYNAYQETQGPVVANRMQKFKYVASFIGNKPGKALFVGLYKIGNRKEMTRQEGNRLPQVIELATHGEALRVPKVGYDPVFKFDLVVEEAMSEFKGRLLVDWPKPAIQWVRQPNGNMPIVAIHETSLLAIEVPKWDEVELNRTEILSLPASWQAAMQQWRGIYFIFDKSVGKGYVGSATGEQNIYGRWMNYAVTGDGGNKLFKKLNADNFVFTIIQLVSQDRPVNEVIELEENWKQRLHTHEPFGLNGKSSKGKIVQIVDDPPAEDGTATD